jgi:hypothetical protein
MRLRHYGNGHIGPSSVQWRQSVCNATRHDQFTGCSVRKSCSTNLAKFEHARRVTVDGDVLSLVLDDETVAVVATAFEAIPAEGT